MACTVTILPTNSFSAANYWVDVVFTPGIYSYKLTSVTDVTGCNSTGDLQTINVTLTGKCDTVPTLPTAVIGNSTACLGEAFSLFLQNASGPGPYDLVINGSTYNNISIGQTI